jgi:hypothetical protein
LLVLLILLFFLLASFAFYMKSFLLSFFLQSFPFEYHVPFSSHTVTPHFFLSIDAKVKLHAMKAYEGVKE